MRGINSGLFCFALTGLAIWNLRYPRLCLGLSIIGPSALNLGLLNGGPSALKCVELQDLLTLQVCDSQYSLTRKTKDCGYHELWLSNLLVGSK